MWIKSTCVLVSFRCWNPVLKSHNPIVHAAWEDRKPDWIAAVEDWVSTSFVLHWFISNLKFRKLNRLHTDCFAFLFHYRLSFDNEGFPLNERLRNVEYCRKTTIGDSRCLNSHFKTPVSGALKSGTQSYEASDPARLVTVFTKEKWDPGWKQVSWMEGKRW